ncbi:hypothetical protein GJAV_G00014270 [Gymnothorax javanicus]|nr:hypothetical protein GJAV_G00014270 [Gymnothorax javanicus]
MYQDIIDFIGACDLCQRQNVLRKAAAELHPIPVPDTAFTQWGMDTVGKLTTTDGGNSYLLVFTEYTTKWVEARAIPTMEAVHVADAIKDIVSRFEVMETIISDQGREFCNSVNEDLCKRLGIKHHVTTAYHPQRERWCYFFSQPPTLITPDCKPATTVGMRGDGNCFICSLSYLVTGDQRHHATLRKVLVQWMDKNPSVVDSLAHQPGYLQRSRMDQLREFATEVEFFAAATLLNTSIWTYSPYSVKDGITSYKWQQYSPEPANTAFPPIGPDHLSAEPLRPLQACVLGVTLALC